MASGGYRRGLRLRECSQILQFLENAVEDEDRAAFGEGAKLRKLRLQVIAPIDPQNALMAVVVGLGRKAVESAFGVHFLERFSEIVEDGSDHAATGENRALHLHLRTVPTHPGSGISMYS